MKILYTGLDTEYYDPKRPHGVEYNNFYLTLKAMPGIEVIEYPFEPILKVGKKEWNQGLLELVKKHDPDILFAMTYSDEFDERTLDLINTTRTITIAWFSDDYWRFFNYSKNLAKHFKFVVTTYHKAVKWYREAGLDNAILSQWACNTKVYSRRENTQDIAVSFIGQYKPARAKVIADLAKRGVRVETYGYGWSNGRVSQDDMLTIISRSKINLNLNTRAGLLAPAVIGRIVAKKSRNRVIPDFHILDNLKAYVHFPTLHTHARPFELAGAGGFVLSGYSDGIERYYVPDKEMVFYKTTDELAEKIKFYLEHDAERIAIREAGYKRTIEEHTYEKRLAAIFEEAMSRTNTTIYS